MEKSFDFCNKCRKDDNCALVHCAVCSFPFHVKCVAPKLTVKACDDLVANPSFHFYCEDHLNLCVHKLLNRISKLERKFKVCIEPLSDISSELEKHQADLKKLGYNKSASPSTKEVAVATSPSYELQPIEAAPNRPQTDGKRGSLHSNVTLRGHNRDRANTEATNGNDPSSQGHESNMNFVDVGQFQQETNQTSNVSETAQQSHASGLQLHLDSSTTQRQPFYQPSSTDNHSISFSVRQNVNNVISNQLEQNLFALPKPRKVFLSHLPAETTIIAIENHLRKNNIPPERVTIEKFQFRTPRKYSSFVINVEEEKMYRHLLNPSHWPFGTIVHEYNSRPDFQFNRRRMMW